jgi:hypothetical protein
MNTGHQTDIMRSEFEESGIMNSSAKAIFEAILVAGVVLALALMPLLVSAESQGRHSPPPFSDFDQNGDGWVSEAEFNETRAARMAAMAEAGKPMKGAATAPSFSDVDTDGDGKLTEAELTAAQQAHHAAMKARHGKHHGKAMPGFEDIDTDSDGCISRKEFDAHHNHS